MIKPIQTFTNFVHKKQFQRQAARIAQEQLYSLYGSKFNYYEVFKAKGGAVGVLGYPDKIQPYSHAYAILPNGDHIQTIADRFQKTERGVRDYFTKLISHADGTYEVKTSSVEKGAMGKVLDVTSNSAEFTLTKNTGKLIDITQYLKR